MTKQRWRRFTPWLLLAAILAVGVTAVVEAGAFDDGGGTAVSQVGPPSSAAPSPTSSISVVPSSAAPSSAAPSSARPSPSASPRQTTARKSSVPTAAAVLPKLSDTHPDYPPTQTLVDKKDGLVVAVYTVQRGDYLSEISDRFQTPLTDVYVWSKDTVGPNANLIYAGQQIVVKVLEKL